MVSVSPNSVSTIKDTGYNTSLVSSMSENNASIGVAIKDENKTTSYGVGIDTSLSRDSEIYVKKTDIYSHKELNDKRIAQMKLNDERVPIKVPLCGEVGSIRTNTTISGDSVSQETRAGLNAEGTACMTAAGIGATVGATELLAATEGVGVLVTAVAAETALVNSAVTK